MFVFKYYFLVENFLFLNRIILLKIILLFFWKYNYMSFFLRKKNLKFENLIFYFKERNMN